MAKTDSNEVTDETKKLEHGHGSLMKFEQKAELTRVEEPGESFLKKAFLLVADAQALTIQRASLAEQMATAKTWAEYLYNVIPEEELLSAFKRAFADHKTTFAINALDVKLAYERILDDRAKAKEKLRQCAIDACGLCNHEGRRRFDPDHPWAQDRLCNHRAPVPIECSKCGGSEWKSNGRGEYSRCPHPEADEDLDANYAEPIDEYRNPLTGRRLGEFGR